MTRTERIEQIHTIMTEKLKLSHIHTLEESMRLNEDLHIDSIMLLQLIVYIEEDLHLVVPADELDPRIFQTVGSLLTFVDQLEPQHVSN
ncbi:acyl carrier protein [Brevibacillus brevis]|uniref:petrobactin biosynthesis protein AsbD n=1 Tax=Brevibacillus brevis TaxID=1393 RepID=UPI001901C520|nr:petrobactin biosynthesis protein AsbD [Brevibacillus brevis]MBH0331912.1 acyl carrier protein [Brevibacillus brevis]